MIPCTFQSGMENIFPCFSPCFHNFNTFALYNKGMVREMRQAENTPLSADRLQTFFISLLFIMYPLSAAADNGLHSPNNASAFLQSFQRL